MSLGKFSSATGIDDVGDSLHRLAARMYPICRSITGSGVRSTLEILQEFAPFQVHEVPSGTQVLDWTVPLEWNIRDAWIKGPDGRIIVSLHHHNLHVVGYSMPFRGTVSLEELRPHLHSIPAKPDVIPFCNTFYQDGWGFCLADRVARELCHGSYEVCIDSTLLPGSLTYGELVLPGETTDEVLLSAHICHPSLANDNLSGLAIAAHVAAYLAKRQHRLTYRIILAPVTIGAITWLAQNGGSVANIKHGLVLALLGDSGGVTYKRSREGTHCVDKVAEYVLGRRGKAHRVVPFSPYGYDERQYGSPGFNLPVGCLMRTPHGEFPEYHTSADNLDFIKEAALENSLDVLLEILSILDRDRTYENLSPFGEPQLGRRGVYRAMADRANGDESEMSLLWVLNQSDGSKSLLDIAEVAGLPFEAIYSSTKMLQSLNLLREVNQIPS